MKLRPSVKGRFLDDTAFSILAIVFVSAEQHSVYYSQMIYASAYQEKHVAFNQSRDDGG